jgi:hypothetical protein
MSDDSDIPVLEDFEESLKTIQYAHNAPKSSNLLQDYTTLNVRHIEDEEKQKVEIKELEKKVENIAIRVESTKKPESFAGFKKGFFGNASKPKEEKPVEVRANPSANPLQFKEVQEAMKVNNYL